MRFTPIREATLLRANTLVSQEKNKKGNKTIQTEINKMSEIFGTDFDKKFYKNLFDEIEFKEMNSLLNQENTKTQYFLDRFQTLLKRPNFISIFSEILMKTENLCSVHEIFDGLNKVIKPNYENQFKILIAFVMSENERFVSDAKTLLWTKCKEVEKKKQTYLLSQNTIQTLLLLVQSFEENKKDTINFLNFIQSNSFQSSDKLKPISDIEKLLDLATEEPIEIEKIYLDIGPMMINNMITCPENEMLSKQLDEKRLATFVMYVLKHQNWVDDKESKFLNRMFLKSLDNDTYKLFDDSNDKKNSTWNIDNFYKMFKDSIDEMNPKKVFEYFDDPSFSIKDKKKFDFFIKTLQKLKILTSPNQLFDFIFSKWTNELNQIEFIEFLLNTPQTDFFSFKSYTGKKVKKNFELSASITKSSNSYLIEPWSCIELIEVLLKLSSGNYYVKVKELFEWPIQNIPEIIALGLISITPDSEDFLYDELIQEVLTLFLGNNMNSFAVIEEVWNRNKDLVIRAISNMYNSSPDLMNLSRILDITQKLKDSLLLLVDCDDYNFAVNLAILAVKRDFLHIEQWLKDRIEKVGDDFINALLTYIKDNLIAHCKANTTTKENILEKSQLSLESLAVIFENLVNAKPSNNPKISQKTEEEIKEVYKSIFEIFDELQLQPVNSAEIEHTANEIFRAMFREEKTVFDTIEKLKEYKDSQEHEKREIYACMIHCLLDEYRFYHQYPEKQLTLVSTLFGQIINHKLIDGVIETIALKYILEGIKKGNGPMFIFGTTALLQFIDKLPEFPSYLKNLIEIKQLKNNPIVYERVLEKYDEEVSSSNNGVPSSSSSSKQTQVPPQSNFDMNPSFSQPTSQNKLPPYAQSMMYDEMGMGGSDQKSKIMKVPSVKGKDFGMGGMSSMLPNQKKEVQPFFMPNNPMMEGFNMNSPNMQSPMSPSMNPLQMGIGNLGNLNINPVAQAPQDEEKTFKNFQNMYNMEMGMQMQGMMGMSNPNTANLLNTSGNLNNMSGLSGNSPKRAAKTKLSRPTNNSSNIGDILGLDSERITPPNQDIIDSMKFIFNSMGKNNVQEKANELKALLTNETIIRWFSSFFIVNRVIAENNNHNIYNDLITFIDHKDLNAYLIKDTIHYINKLLASDSIEKDLKEKTALKNLGSWLGLMTLAKNKPILAKDLDLKEIIFNAYENGKLSYIVTFISKILEHSAKTKVFHAKNPWMQAILTLFTELLFMPNLKPNLTFEIENLFKRIEIDIKSYPKSKLLEKLSLPANSPDFNRSNPQTAMPTNDLQMEQINLNELFSKINALDSYVINIFSLLNAHSNQMISKQDLVSLLTQVLSMSINEILGPVVERAVNISLITTKQLVIKDFLFENDEKKFKIAASNCIKSLAGSLALVTCKEPLRINYNIFLKDILQSKNYDEESIDLIANHSSSELLDIGCSYIHNYVIKKAIEKIQNDDTILNEIERRKRNKMFDMKSELAIKSRMLPDVIRPLATGLTQEQLQIYDNYDKIYESYTKYEQTAKNSSVLNIIIKMLKEVLDSVNVGAARLTKNYEFCMINIQNISLDSSISFEEGSDHLSVLEKCVTECKVDDANIQKEFANSSLRFAMNATKKRNPQLLTIYTCFIKGWVKLQPQIAQDITAHLFSFGDISTRLNLDLHVILFKKEIIVISDYEDYLYEYLESSATREQSITLLNGLNEAKIYSPDKFKKILPFMLDRTKCVNYFTLFGEKNKLPSDLNIKRESIIDYKICNIKDINTYQIFSKMCYVAFNQIVDTMCPFQVKHMERYLQKLKNFLDSPFISNEEQMNVFIMIITELCIKKIVNENVNTNNDYPENEAKAIYALLSVIPKKKNKLKMFSNILFGIFKTFHHDYVKSNVNFNQRPYYKLFYTFLSLLAPYKSSDEIFFSELKKINFLFALGDCFKNLSPVNYPGFAFAWLDLISCKHFISNFLEAEPNTKPKESIHKLEKYLYLFIDLFTFLKQHAAETISDFNSKAFLDNVYKFMFLLCNTYPEFISAYYYIIIASLPPGTNYLQLKNMILSCKPKDIELPDPFNEDGKDIAVPEKRKNAYILFDIASILQDYNFKSIIDFYIETKSEIHIEELCKKLNGNKNRDSNFYVINAIVIYWSQKMIKQLQEKKLKVSDFSDFFIKILKMLDNDNRDHLINSMLNELRFPSNQTIFFHYLMIYIMNEIKNEIIEEHIIRNIIGRLIFKPNPWGLVHFFVQLMKNGKYVIMKRPFILKNKADELLQKISLSVKNDKMKNYISN